MIKTEGGSYEIKSTTRKKPLLRRYKKLREKINNSFWTINAIEVDTTKINPNGQRYNFIDLFSGAGGMSLGFVMANFTPIFSVDIDPYASATYRRNFPSSKHYEGDIRDVTVEDIRSAIGEKEVHVLCGGPPCQGFSVAGKRDPNDPRNDLFKEMVRIAKGLQPWFIVMENVPGIVTMKRGKILQRIKEEFESIGYNVSLKILESAEYGVPQVRPRAIFIGNRWDMKNPFPKPILKDEKDWIPIEKAIDDLKHRPRDPRINHEWTMHSKETEERIAKVPPGGSLYKSFYDAFKRQYKGYPAMTIKENHGGTHIHYELNRVLSVREMARLQSFPDTFIFEGGLKKGYLQVGNAVPPLLAKHIALALRVSLDEIATMAH